MTAVGTKHDHFNQDTNSSDQLFAFALGGSLELASETLCKEFKQMTAQVGRAMSPNLVVTLEGHHVLSPVVSSGNATLANSVQEANSVYCVTHPDSGFQFLLSKLHAMFRNGRTVDATAFDRYFSTEGTLSLPRRRCTRVIGRIDLAPLSSRTTALNTVAR